MSVERARLDRLFARLSPGERRALLAGAGRYPLGGPVLDEEVAQRLQNWVRQSPDDFLCAVQHEPPTLALLAPSGAPGRSSALLLLARTLRRPIPASEYVLVEDTLVALLRRAEQIAGARIPLSGSARHKGRVGDGVERLLVGDKVSGRLPDHAEAEIKTVPVRGGRILERVKLAQLGADREPLGPLAKCRRILFVFVERRGVDHFVRGHHLHEFDFAAWPRLLHERWVVETAAGSPSRPRRGLYLVPKWFARARIWPRGSAHI